MALAVAALVVLCVSAAVSVTADVAARGRDETDRVLRLEAKRIALRRWLTAAHVGRTDLGAQFTGKDGEVRGHTSDELTFLTLDPAWLRGVEGSTWIRLRVAGDSGLIVQYLEADSLVVNWERAFRSMSLFPEVRGMDCRYLVALGNELRWFSGWSSRVRLPGAVEIRFVAAPGDTLAKALALPLLVNLPRRG